MSMIVVYYGRLDLVEKIEALMRTKNRIKSAPTKLEKTSMAIIKIKISKSQSKIYHTWKFFRFFCEYHLISTF